MYDPERDSESESERQSDSAPSRPPLLTKRGGTLLGASAGLIVGSRLLGADELALLGLAGLALLLLAIAWTRSLRLTFAAVRVRHPARLHVGTAARFELEITNVGTRPTTLVTIADGFDQGRRAARFVVPPVSPGETIRAAYRIPTARRGRFRVGPLQASVTDAFGVARRDIVVEGVTDVVVCPRVRTLRPPILGSGRAGGLDAGSSPRGVVNDAHGEFRTLRDYVVGDELRRVHWRSTARTDDLIVRQDEAPWLPRATVVLDVRASAFDEAAFETAVEATASVMACLRLQRRDVELLTSSGASLTHATADWSHALLEQLATIEVDDGPDHLGLVLTALGRRRDTGLVVAVVGSLDSPTAHALELLASRLATVAVVTRSGVGTEASRLLVVDAVHKPFRVAWNQAMARWSVATSSRPLRSRR